jgi:hypothetical protein
MVVSSPRFGAVNVAPKREWDALQEVCQRIGNSPKG